VTDSRPKSSGDGGSGGETKSEPKKSESPAA
jgi:hypothetical protein